MEITSSEWSIETITLLQIQYQNGHVVPSTQFDYQVVCLDAVTSIQSVSHSMIVTVGCVDPRISTSHYVVKEVRSVSRQEKRRNRMMTLMLLNIVVNYGSIFRCSLAHRGILLLWQ